MKRLAFLAAVVTACSGFGDATGAPGPDPTPDAVAPPPPPPGVDGGDVDAASTTDAGSACKGVVDCERYVFVTSDTYAGEDIGGSVAGDGKCTIRASLDTTLPSIRGRKFKAWLSDSNATFEVAARLSHGTKAYRLVDGTVIANSWTQLVTGSLFHAIDVDETGATVPAGGYVWTGTSIFGNPTQTTCTSWTLNGAANTGTVGRSDASDSTWTNSGSMNCGTGYRMYCFEE